MVDPSEIKKKVSKSHQINMERQQSESLETTMTYNQYMDQLAEAEAFHGGYGYEQVNNVPHPTANTGNNRPDINNNYSEEAR